MAAPTLPPGLPTRRHTVAGCLVGCLGRLIGGLLAGVVVVLGLFAVTAPWGFYLGGQFHPLAYWQGWGVLHGPGGDYAVFVRMFPWPHKRTPFNRSGPSVRGSGYVCSPHGERYGLSLHGNFVSAGIGTNTDGEPMALALVERLNYWKTNRSNRLELSFRGVWKNPDLILSDEGSFIRAFNPDGTWTPGDHANRPAGQPVPLPLHPGSGTDFDAACASVKR
jgi:hypothetical protein